MLQHHFIAVGVPQPISRIRFTVLAAYSILAVPILVGCSSSDGPGSRTERSEGVDGPLEPHVVGPAGTLTGHAARVTDLAFSPDGRLLASASEDGTVRLWNPASCSEVACLDADSAPQRSLAFSPDGRYLVAGGDGASIKLWDMEHRKAVKIWKAPPPAFEGPTARVRSVAFMLDGKGILFGTYSGMVGNYLLDAEEPKIIESDRLSIFCIACSPNGRLVLVCHSSGADLIDLRSGQDVISVEDTLGSATAAAFSVDGREVIVSSGRFAIWYDAFSGEELRRSMRHGAQIQQLKYNGGALVTSASDQSLGYDPTVRVLDFTTGEEIVKFEGHEHSVTSLAVSPNGLHAASADMEDPTIRLWGLPRSEAAASIKQRGPSKSDQEVVIGPNEYYMRATVYQKSGDLKRAFVVLTAAIQLYPNHVDAYGLRGDILRATGHFGQAVEDYTQIIRMTPENSRAYELRGMTYYDQNDIERAVQDFNQAIRHDPKNADAFHQRGRCYGDRRELAQSIKDFEAAVRLEPERGIFWSDLGIVHSHKGDVEKSLACFSEAIRLAPRNAEIYCKRAAVYEQIGKHDKAAADLATAARLEKKAALDD